jgi:hypothetical protein
MCLALISMWEPIKPYWQGWTGLQGFVRDIWGPLTLDEYNGMRETGEHRSSGPMALDRCAQSRGDSAT